MRLLFTSLGSFGHTFPLVPLAVAARDAGHDVVFATSEDFLPQLTKAGLETAAAGLGLREGFQQAFGAQGDTGPLTLNIDVAPTFLDLAGAPIPADYQGKSWLGLFRDSSAAWTFTIRSTAITAPWWLTPPRTGDLFASPVST